MSLNAHELARKQGGCGEVVNVAAWTDGNAVPSTAGLCNSPGKHKEHIREGLLAIGCPPDVADYIAREDEREQERRERWARMAEYDGPVVFRKVEGES